MPKWIKFKATVKILPPLLLDQVAKSFIYYFTKAHDGKTKIKNYRQALEGRWFKGEDIKAYEKMLGEQSPSILLKWSKEYRKKFLELEKFSKNISKKRFENLSKTALLKIFKRFNILCIKTFCYVYDYVILNRFYSERLNEIILKYASIKILNEYLSFISGLDKPTDVHFSRKLLGEIALRARQKRVDKNVKKMIRKYVKKFGYLKMFAYFGEPFSEKDVEKSVKELSRKSKEKIIKEVEVIKELKRNEKKTKEFIKKLGPKKKDVEAIKVLKEYAYTSLFADELYHKIPYLVKPLLLDICKRINVSYNQFIHMTSDEIVLALKRGVSLKSINRINSRIKNFDFVYDNGRIKILIGKDLERYASKQKQEELKLLKCKELKGQTVFPGRKIGKVKTIKEIEDILSFGSGNILVATSTNPTLVSAMQKAAAIITDEGGLLSHAAIVSREFKVPCTIGTKIATKVLRDGDLVEVDANKGIVKILKRARG